MLPSPDGELFYASIMTFVRSLLTNPDSVPSRKASHSERRSPQSPGRSPWQVPSAGKDTWSGQDYFLKTAARLAPASPSSITGTVLNSNRSAHCAAWKWSAARLLVSTSANPPLHATSCQRPRRSHPPAHFLHPLESAPRRLSLTQVTGPTLS